MPDAPPVGEFLSALFGHLAEREGWIEVRLLGEKSKPAPVVDRRWVRTPAELATQFPSLAAKAEAASAGFFFGVLPRRADGAGKATDVTDGMVAWVDLDFRDFEGGAGQARTGLNTFAIQPSITVATGHGVHAYWLFKEPTAPLTLSQISGGLARALGGDHVNDPARILRMPGSKNMKQDPKLVLLESLHPDRTYTETDFEGYLPENTPERPALTGTARIGEGISERIRLVVEKDKRVADLWHSRGKTESTEFGPADHSSSGYDWSLVLALVKRGFTDVDELCTALWYRPDDSARHKGVAYVERTVRNALAKAGPPMKPPNGTNGNGHGSAGFASCKLIIEDSADPIYWLVCQDGKSRIRLTAEQLITPREFRTRYMAVVHEIPEMPKSAVAWHEVVNGWLKDATHVEQPPEASEFEGNKQLIERCIETAPRGETKADLESGKVLTAKNGAPVVTTYAIIRQLQQTQRMTLKFRDACSLLRDLGYRSETMRLEGAVVRAWVGPQTERDPQ